MTTYQTIELIISGFTAVGTCGATILALYFWYHGRILKLRFHAMHGNRYGSIPDILNGYLVLKFTNIGYEPISLELAGFKFMRGFWISKINTIIEFGMQTNNLLNDKLPKLLQHGDGYTYVISWDDFLKSARETKHKKNKNLCICFFS